MAEFQTPGLVHVADLVVRIAEPIEIGRISGNLRRVIPIAGGEVLGPALPDAESLRMLWGTLSGPRGDAFFSSNVSVGAPR
jgi:hypothetical protein